MITLLMFMLKDYLVLAGLAIIGLFVRGFVKIEREPKPATPSRSVPPRDLGASFEKMKRRDPYIEQLEHRIFDNMHNSTYSGAVDKLLVPMNKVKTLTRSAFTAGGKANSPLREVRQTYQEWEKENLP